MKKQKRQLRKCPMCLKFVPVRTDYLAALVASFLKMPIKRWMIEKFFAGHPAKESPTANEADSKYIGCKGGGQVIR